MTEATKSGSGGGWPHCLRKNGGRRDAVPVLPRRSSHPPTPCRSTRDWTSPRAKPTPEEMCGIPHHLIGCVPMDANFSVADYLALAKPVIADIHRRGKLPVLVGGAGMYVSSLLSNVQLAPHTAGCQAAGGVPAVRCGARQRGAASEAGTAGSGDSGCHSPK
ncbi:MAG: tRNA dimethylallyltransferase [Ruminococcus sp.]